MKKKKWMSTLLALVMTAGVVSGFTGCVDNGEEKQEPYVAKQLANEADYEKVFYVSEEVGDDSALGTWDAPFKTITKAQEAVDAVNDDMQGDIAVVLRRGLYTQSKTLQFDETDGGTNGHDVIYMGYPEETSSISGGVELSNWKKQGDLYYTSVSANYIRDLWVDGTRATLARTPNGPDFTQVAEVDSRDAGNGKHCYVENIYANLADLKGADQFEIVCYMEWAEPILRVESVTEKDGRGLLNIASPEKEMFFDWGFVLPQVRNDMYVYYQNAKEFLDEPGEFYFAKDEGRLYYYPHEGENMKKVKAVVSNLTQVVDITGKDKDTLVQNIRFENLVFEHNTDTLVATQGYRDVQASHYQDPEHNATWNVMRAAIIVERAKNIDFENCRTQHTGSGGLLFLTNASYCEVRGNVFTDTAAYGVTIAPGADSYVGHSLYTTPFKELICHDIIVDNNYVTWVGSVFRRSVGIANMHGYNIKITNNEVAYCSSTGIHCGWGWSLNKYNAKNNYIARNNVHNFGMYSSDLGGIYTLNNQPGLIIEENYVHDAASNGMGYSSASCAEGIYLDEGTNNAVVRKNQIAYVTRCKDAIMYHVAGDNIVEEDNRCAMALENNVLDETIIAAAGPQGEYKKNAPYTVVDGAVKIHTSNGLQTAKEGGMYGMKIQCDTDTTVYGLGRFYILGNRQTHKLSIYDAKKNLLASCTVNMLQGTVDQYGYKYARFDKPLQLKKGESYFLTSEEHSDGDAYLYTNTSVRLDGFTVLGIVRGEKLFHVKDVYSSYGFVGLNVLLK